MEKVQEVFEKVKEYAVYYYGPEQPQRMWYFVLTAFLFLCFPKGTRRYGAIGLSVGILAFVVWGFLSTTFQQTAPDPLTQAQQDARKKR
jgi:hypothetical protein